MLPQFGWSSVITHWQFAPVVSTAVAISAGLYWWGVVRVARQHPARPWPAWRTGFFAVGLAVLVVATESGIGVYDNLLYWDHMIQHLLLIMVAPVLLIAGQPVTLLLHASRNPLHTWAKHLLRSKAVALLTWPVFGTGLYAVAIIVAHLTGVASLIARDQFWHNLEHVVFLLVGYLFFLPILGREPIRWRLSYPVRFVLLVLTMPVDTFTGLMLGFGGPGSPGLPVGPRPGWAPSPVDDLHLGGAVMWIGGDCIMFGLMMLVFWMWSTDERAWHAGAGWFEAARRENLATLVASRQPGTGEPDPVPGGGGIDDDDEHLAAYNAYLARLNRAESTDQGH